ncbi:MAG: DEAD/DEAH box helicase [Dysgonamonadaceae bacterium]|jgi:superfamily II DNA/RNA helicase|nr:DEAD/DEAH box helicase [Dysgonamonadaceae bacterium]
MNAAKKSTKKTSKKPQSAIPYHYKPERLSLEAWQIALRKQFVENKSFGIEKTDRSKSPFGDYFVQNPETGNRYKVAFRGLESPMNFCSCLDFKTNRLGTCKHLEAVIYQLKNKPGKSGLNKEHIPDYTSVYLSYQNGREIKIRIGKQNKADFEELATKYFDRNHTLLAESIDCFIDFLEDAKSIDPGFRCYDDALEFILDIRENKKRRKVARKYTKPEAFAGLMNATLFPYQQEGIRFAFEAGRSLIADEMGLGKTIQAIGTCQLLRKEIGIEKALIICPTSLKYQWQSEIKKFTDKQTLVIEGTPNIRWEQYKSNEFYKIVSYHTAVNDIKHIVAQNFDVIVLDEAQRIKNWKTKIAQTVKKIYTPYCVVLTGTPLENKIDELYSIVQFIDPYRLGPYYKFLDYYQVKDSSGKVIGYEHLDEIGTLLADVLKRRRKSDVLLQLPDRMDKNLFVPMTAQQQDMHTEFQDAVAKLVHKWRKLGFLPEKDRQRLLINLNMMRMSCDSTYLFDQKTRHDTKIDELMSILSEYFEGNQEKAVIFSQWERMTRIIAGELEAAGIKYEYLHGGIPSKDRKDLFENFNNSADSRVFLSTDAGSTGLNLQAASLIINMDIPWNPAVLEQRIARIHRMGQKSSVSVINFVSTGTIEHRMLDVLKFKSSLAQGILDRGESAIFLSDSKFNAFMKDIEQMTVQPETEEMIYAPVSEEENTVESSRSAHQADFTPDASTETMVIPGDDDIKPEASPETPEKIHPEEKATGSGNEAADLLAQGFSFLSGLAKTLSSQESTEKLVHSLVEKDEKTGKTHLKIPVESEETVSNVLNMLGTLFKGLGKSV